MAVSAIGRVRRYGRREVVSFRGTAICLATMLAFVAGSGTPGWATSRVDACKLIDPLKAGSILGEKVEPKPVGPTSRGGGNTSMCNYANGSMQGGFMLLVGALDAGANIDVEVKQEKARIIAESRKNLGFAPTIENIGGIGKAAYLVEIMGSVQLHVLTGREAIVISRNQSASPELARKLGLLAKAALSGL